MNIRVTILIYNMPTKILTYFNHEKIHTPSTDNAFGVSLKISERKLIYILKTRLFCTQRKIRF